jgi:beta-lactamase regulating signal transducer with metallopeptidase domain
VVILVGGLIATAILVGCVAGPFLDRLRPSAISPGTAIVCWASALAGTLIASTGVVVVALLSPPGPGHGLLERLRNCLPHHGDPAIVLATAASLVLLAACGARLARSLPRLVRAVRHRRRHREMLRLVAREDGRHPDVLVLDHPVPVAYSLPSRRRAIVISTGARKALSAAELGAVLAHERAHLRQRHHALLLLLDLAHALLPWLPTIRRAKERLPLLLEMAADDAAARTCGRRTLVDALCRLSAVPGLAGVLGATGGAGTGALVKRVRRLESSEAGQFRESSLVAAPMFVMFAVAVPLVMVVLSIAELAVIC